MENVNIASLTLDEIVFENRNRNYGAYDLRIAYEKHMIRGVFIGTMLFLCLFTPLYISNLIEYFFPSQVEQFAPPLDPPTVLSGDIFEVIPERPPVAPAPKSEVNTVRNVPLVAVADNKVDPKEELATADKLQNAVSGPATVEGTGELNLPLVEPSTGVEGGTGILEDAVENTNSILNFAEEMPEYPGGQAAMLKFIGKHLRYPSSAQSNGISGVVYVSFVIDPTGKVTQIQVLKGIDTACDEEAVRVISKMPAWKPGRQSNRNVSVRYSLPIRFAMQ